MLAIGLSPAKEFRTKASAADLDRYLVEIASNDSQALAALYHSTSVSIYAFALSILKNIQDAEDILQDSYLSIHAAAPSYRSAGKPMAWILTITRNLCFLKLRENQKTVNIPPEDWDCSRETYRELSAEDKLVLAECMNRLSDEEREIIALHAVAGFKHREIAEMMDLPLSTVLSKYHRAIKKLKQYL